MKNEKELLLNIEPKEVVCKIIGRWHTRLSGNIFEYSVSNQKFTHHKSHGIFFEKGEYYQGNYANSEPAIIEIDLTLPIILNEENYNEVIGDVIKTNIKSNPNSVLFTYSVSGKKYKRDVYVDNANLYREGISYFILVKKGNPKVSYLKDQLKSIKKN